MTKTIIVLMLTGYSMTRLLTGAFQIYAEILRLPLWVLGVTGFCCFCCLAGGVMLLFKKLRGRTLRQILFINALGAAVNIAGLFLNPISNLTVYELIVTGTAFDILFFIGTMGLHLRDTVRDSQVGWSPFSRMAGRRRAAYQEGLEEETGEADGRSGRDGLLVK